jgi:hypothetical protein
VSFRAAKTRLDLAVALGGRADAGVTEHEADVVTEVVHEGLKLRAVRAPQAAQSARGLHGRGALGMRTSGVVKPRPAWDGEAMLRILTQGPVSIFV